MSSPNLSRRRLLSLSAATLLSHSLWPGALAAQDVASSDFDFICVNDLHYIDDKCVPFFQKMTAKMKSDAPAAKLLLVAGDLCEDGTTQQLGGIRNTLKALDVTTKVVIGNHDWTNQTDRKMYDQIWPDSINYTFDHGGWQFVGLDSSDGVKYQNTSILTPTLDWVDQTLPKLDRKRPMVLFTHFPLGPDVRYRPANAEDLLNRFKEHNLRAVFNGHFHSHTQRQRGDWLITTNKCCSLRRNNHDGTPEKGFFLCHAKDGKVTREFVRVA
jgi:3',5'-cyclic AMP phosphodiesterase CpdA